MINNFENIIWDWNGTLLDDMDICIKSMNHLIMERNLPQLTVEKYKKLFKFPVREYYEELGFNLENENFDIPALQFIDYYKSYLPEANLFKEVAAVLQNFHKNGLNQFILSAMEQQSLVSSVQTFHIDMYFTNIYGIQNHFAHSKMERGEQLLQIENLNRNKTLMIGDTLHDKEVADAMGIRCILVAQGHQDEKRLTINGNKVIPNLLTLLVNL